MDLHLHYLINSGFCWLIVLLAIAGYVLTLKRLKQRWVFWIILSIGWGLLAVSNSISALGIGHGMPYIFSLWLASYVLVIASLTLLFIKLIQLMKAKEKAVGN
jgi:hypothetical protein